MAKFSKFLFISLLVITVIFGLEQLSNENNVFADTKAYCCNNGLCDDQNCSSLSSVNTFSQTGPGCTEGYLITCKECIDLTYAGDELCPFGPLTAYCWDGENCYGWCNGIWNFD